MSSENKESEPPKTLRECIAPLASGAAQSALMAYSWAHVNLKERLSSCQRVIDAAENVIDQCNQLLKEELKQMEREKTKTTNKP